MQAYKCVSLNSNGYTHEQLDPVPDLVYICMLDIYVCKYIYNWGDHRIIDTAQLVIMIPSVVSARSFQWKFSFVWEIQWPRPADHSSIHEPWLL